MTPYAATTAKILRSACARGRFLTSISKKMNLVGSRLEFVIERFSYDLEKWFR